MTLGYTSYEGYKRELDKAIAESAEGFVRIGYLLKVARDTDILHQSGYGSVTDFAMAEYGIDKTQVSRFIRINDRFSEGGYSDRLEQKYRGFGHTKLTLMLQLPDAMTEVLTPDMTRKEIQTLKEDMDEENAVSDIEIAIEAAAPRERTETEELIRELGRVGSLYEDIHKAKRQGVTDYIEIMAPDDEKIYTVRLQGVGRVMLAIKDGAITTVNFRTGEKKAISRDEINAAWDEIIHAELQPGESWEREYGEAPARETEKEPVKDTKVVSMPKRKEDREEKQEEKPKEKPGKNTADAYIPPKEEPKKQEAEAREEAQAEQEVIVEEKLPRCLAEEDAPCSVCGTSGKKIKLITKDGRELSPVSLCRTCAGMITKALEEAYE